MTRDEFIFKKLQETVWKGKVWHEIKYISVIEGNTREWWKCSCGKCFPKELSAAQHIRDNPNPDFSTWPGFGMLLEGMKEYDKKNHPHPDDGFLISTGDDNHETMYLDLISPDAFADEVAKFFGWEEGKYGCL